MRASILTFTVSASVLAFVVEYREWLDLHKSAVHKVAPGPCKHVAEENGSEDATYIGNGIVLFSSGFGRRDGKIRALDLNTSNVEDMKIRGAPDRDDFMTSPHGITTWKDSRDQIYLYVVTHPPKEDRIEVFKVKPNNVLKYKRTITDPGFKFMNDLVAVDKDKFYITRCLNYRDRWRQNMEIFGRVTWGGIMYFDGQKAREVVSGLSVPNGINISPDGKMVYVAESGTRKLLGFSRSDVNSLSTSWEKEVKTLVDNIEVDPLTGDLWTGCHPVVYRILVPFPIFQFTPPSQVLRFKMEDNMVTDVEEIYADDGAELKGSTVATYAEGKLIIGTVAEKTLLCDTSQRPRGGPGNPEESRRRQGSTTFRSAEFGKSFHLVLDCFHQRVVRRDTYYRIIKSPPLFQSKTVMEK